MRKLTTALVSAATAAALALSIAPTAVAQSAFSLSSSGSKPAPSGPKNPTPKPGDSNEVKLKAYENSFATLYTTLGATRTSDLDKAAKAGVTKALNGEVTFYEDPEIDFTYAQVAEGETGLVIMRSGIDLIPVLGSDYDKELEKVLNEEVADEDRIEGNFGLASGLDKDHFFIVIAIDIEEQP